MITPSDEEVLLKPSPFVHVISLMYRAPGTRLRFACVRFPSLSTAVVNTRVSFPNKDLSSEGVCSTIAQEQLTTPDSSSSMPLHATDKAFMEFTKSISMLIPSITVPFDGGVASNVSFFDDITVRRPARFSITTVT